MKTPLAALIALAALAALADSPAPSAGVPRLPRLTGPHAESPRNPSSPASSSRASEGWKEVWLEGLPREIFRNPRFPSLPEVYGEVVWGIAEKYPDDEGLERDKAVIFKVDFDNNRVPDRIRGIRFDEWSGVPWSQDTEISDVDPVTGRYCAANTWPGLDNGGTATRWHLGELKDLVRKYDRPALFMRLYNKFDANFYGEGRVFGMKGFGFVAMAMKPGMNTLADGRNWFTAEMQWTGWGPSAKTDIYRNLCIHGHLYSYMPYPESITTTLQETLRTTPGRFSAYAKERTWVHLDEWYCYEVGLYMNRPGKADGEARFWENGRLTTRIKHMRFADTLDAFKLYAIVSNVRTQHDGSNERATRYLDNVVVADRYIGPIKFSRERIKHFLDAGIVVHTGDDALTERMRRARAARE